MTRTLICLLALTLGSCAKSEDAAPMSTAAPAGASKAPASYAADGKDDDGEAPSYGPAVRFASEGKQMAFAPEPEPKPMPKSEVPAVVAPPPPPPMQGLHAIARPVNAATAPPPEPADGLFEVQDKETAGDKKALLDPAGRDQWQAVVAKPAPAAVEREKIELGVVGRGARGMGLRGTGPGGGGEGFGRIHGMGRVDTGGGRGAWAQRAGKGKKKRKVTVRHGPIEVAGRCDPGVIERVLGARQRGVRYCYERALRGDPGLAGTITLSWRIAPNGRVTRVAVVADSVGDAAVAACMRRQIRRWRFPKPEAGACEIEAAFALGASAEPARRTSRHRAGQARGVRLGGLRPDATLRRLGLRPGDTLLAIDGRAVDSAAAATEAFAGALNQRVFEVERDGTRQVIYPDVAEIDLDTRKPERFLPRMFYFENTYLGRSPAYLEQVRQLDADFEPDQRPYAAATLPAQPLDAPTDAGLSLTATLDRPSIDQPGRVFLQVALQGSRRFGWRRPPVDLALVIDASVAGAAPETLTRAVTGLLRRLGPQDRLGVVVVDPAGPRVLTDVVALREARTRLTRSLVDFQGAASSEPSALGEALVAAGGMLRVAAEGRTRVPGSQTVLLLTQGHDDRRVGAAEAVAHQLTVQGAVTSVIDLDGDGAWWRVANAGHGNDHRGRALDEALDAELERLSRVIARLLRVNIRLGPDVQAIRVLGSRVLEQAEVERVKAREEATDRQISKTMGVKADRGEDDDGIQTVIPYFLGGDAHVILVELWVDTPGAVAEVTLKYKDMVALDNATARASVSLAGLPRPRTAAHRGVQRNVRGFELAESLALASRHLRRGDAAGAQAALRSATTVSAADRTLVEGFRQLLRAPRGHRVADALQVASRRRISHATSR